MATIKVCSGFWMSVSWRETKVEIRWVAWFLVCWEGYKTVSMFYYLWPLSDEETKTHRSISKTYVSVLLYFMTSFIFTNLLKVTYISWVGIRFFVLNFCKRKKGFWSIHFYPTQRNKKVQPCGCRRQQVKRDIFNCRHGELSECGNLLHVPTPHWNHLCCSERLLSQRGPGDMTVLGFSSMRQTLTKRDSLRSETQ